MMAPLQLLLILHYFRKNFPPIKVNNSSDACKHIKWAEVGNFLEILSKQQKASIDMFHFLAFLPVNVILTTFFIKTD
jgi:hypothetical protein